MYHGPTPPADREQIKKAFNADPKQNPLRILIATDAAREGLNLQAHCWNLFHFDVPWNPGRMEQRNGRIDRKLQPNDDVYCHYFFYTQRPEDRILKVLVEKTKRIQEELGSLSQVIEGRLERLMKNGIRRRDLSALESEIRDADIEKERRDTMQDELDSARERQDALREQIDRLRGMVIAPAKPWPSRKNPSAPPSPVDSASQAPNHSILTRHDIPAPRNILPRNRPARRSRPHLGRDTRRTA